VEAAAEVAADVTEITARTDITAAAVVEVAADDAAEGGAVAEEEAAVAAADDVADMVPPIVEMTARNMKAATMAMRCLWLPVRACSKCTRTVTASFAIPVLTSRASGPTPSCPAR
jgi:hypothetical protein